MYEYYIPPEPFDSGGLRQLLGARVMWQLPVVQQLAGGWPESRPCSKAERALRSCGRYLHTLAPVAAVVHVPAWLLLQWRSLVAGVEPVMDGD